MARVQFEYGVRCEFELRIRDQSKDESLVRAQAWVADAEGEVWTAHAVFPADLFLLHAGSLLNPAVYAEGLTERDGLASESLLAADLPCYLEHVWPGRLVVGETLWKGGDVWVMPKRCSCRIDVAASDDAMWRKGAPLLVRIRGADLHAPGEPAQKVPDFVYAVEALDMLAWGEMADEATTSDSSLSYPAPLVWKRTDERGEAQPFIEFPRT